MPLIIFSTPQWDEWLGIYFWNQKSGVRRSWEKQKRGWRRAVVLRVSFPPAWKFQENTGCKCDSSSQPEDVKNQDLEKKYFFTFFFFACVCVAWVHVCVLHLHVRGVLCVCVCWHQAYSLYNIYWGRASCWAQKPPLSGSAVCQIACGEVPYLCLLSARTTGDHHTYPAFASVLRL